MRSNGGSAWTIEFERSADRALDKLDQAIQRRIVLYLKERVLTLHDPRQIGEGLVGTMAGYWRYRVGDYRII